MKSSSKEALEFNDENIKKREIFSKQQPKVTKNFQ